MYIPQRVQGLLNGYGKEGGLYTAPLIPGRFLVFLVGLPGIL
jgi:hypothetical protein